MITLREIYQALSALDCAVTRGWPQAMIPLPAIAFSGCEDSVGEDGSRRFQVELKARAASPEGADALAAGAAEAPVAGASFWPQAARVKAAAVNAAARSAVRLEKSIMSEAP